MRAESVQPNDFGSSCRYWPVPCASYGCGAADVKLLSSGTVTDERVSNVNNLVAKYGQHARKVQLILQYTQHTMSLVSCESAAVAHDLYSCVIKDARMGDVDVDSELLNYYTTAYIAHLSLWEEQ